MIYYDAENRKGKNKTKLLSVGMQMIVIYQECRLVQSCTGEIKKYKIVSYAYF